jgi:hypothetical protein
MNALTALLHACVAALHRSPRAGLQARHKCLHAMCVWWRCPLPPASTHFRLSRKHLPPLAPAAARPCGVGKLGETVPPCGGKWIRLPPMSQQCRAPGARSRALSCHCVLVLPRHMLSSTLQNSAMLPALQSPIVATAAAMTTAAPAAVAAASAAELNLYFTSIRRNVLNVVGRALLDLNPTLG